MHRHTGGTPRRINTLCSRVLQFGALDERTSITAEMVDEVADEMAEGMNGVEAASQSNGLPASASDDANGHVRTSYPVLQSRASGDPGDLLHRIEALEETTARQDRIFQRIVKLLAAAVEKEP
jgi:general secretion pathway protein A